MPVHRYRQGRRASSVYISTHAESEVVQEYHHLLAMRGPIWASCVKDAIDNYEMAILKDGVVRRPDRFVNGKAFLGMLKEVQFGHIKMDGAVHIDGWEGDVGWELNHRCAWQVN